MLNNVIDSSREKYTAWITKHEDDKFGYDLKNNIIFNVVNRKASGQLTHRNPTDYAAPHKC